MHLVIAACWCDAQAEAKKAVIELPSNIQLDTPPRRRRRSYGNSKARR